MPQHSAGVRIRGVPANANSTLFSGRQKWNISVLPGTWYFVIPVRYVLSDNVRESIAKMTNQETKACKTYISGIHTITSINHVLGRIYITH